MNKAITFPDFYFFSIIILNFVFYFILYFRDLTKKYKGV